MIMTSKTTYKSNAQDIELWKEYVDPNAAMTDEEFYSMTVADKIEMQIDMFGPESTDDFETYYRDQEEREYYDNESHYPA